MKKTLTVGSILTLALGWIVGLGAILFVIFR